LPETTVPEADYNDVVSINYDIKSSSWRARKGYDFGNKGCA
jgi:hypothetical protein